MPIKIQNYRGLTSGDQPPSLLPGQIAFNLADSHIFLGYGGDVNYDVNGDPLPDLPPEGEGWKEFPLVDAVGGVTKLVAGDNVTLSPSSGLGEVTINASGGGAAPVTQIIAGTNVTVDPSDGLGAVTVNATSPWVTVSGVAQSDQTTTIYSVVVPRNDVFAGWGFLSVNVGTDILATYELQITQTRPGFPPGPAGPAPIVNRTLYYQNPTVIEPIPTVSVAWDLNGAGNTMNLNITVTNGTCAYQLTFNRTT